jgi:hypothetical protein
MELRVTCNDDGVSSKGVVFMITYVETSIASVLPSDSLAEVELPWNEPSYTNLVPALFQSASSIEFPDDAQADFPDNIIDIANPAYTGALVERFVDSGGTEAMVGHDYDGVSGGVTMNAVGEASQWGITFLSSTPGGQTVFRRNGVVTGWEVHATALDTLLLQVWRLVVGTYELVGETRYTIITLWHPNLRAPSHHTTTPSFAASSYRRALTPLN